MPCCADLPENRAGSSNNCNNPLTMTARPVANYILNFKFENQNLKFYNGNKMLSKSGRILKQTVTNPLTARLVAKYIQNVYDLSKKQSSFFITNQS